MKKIKAPFLLEIKCNIFAVLLLFSVLSIHPIKAQVVSTFAGSSGTSGAVNSTGAAASFNTPVGVAADAAGNVYVADISNNLIRKISPAGAVTTLAGSGTAGSTDGTGTAASFNTPWGIAVDAAGNVYVADSGNHKIRKITPAGVVSTIASSPDVQDPFGVAVDLTGNVYVAEFGNGRIQKITPAGVVSTLAGLAQTSGSTDGTGTAASFNTPCGITVDAAGTVYIADFFNSLIRKITPAGVVSTFAGSPAGNGSADGTGTAASFSGPTGVAVDASGNLYVSDQNNEKIRRISPAGVVTTVAGSGSFGSANGTGAAASFTTPRGLCVDATGSILYIADQGNYTVRKIILPVPEIKVSQAGAELISSAGSYNFGNVNMLSTSSTITFTIDNLASAGKILSFTGPPVATVSGANASDFTINTSLTTTTVTVGSNTTFTITFTPSSSGTRSAVVTIGNDDIDEGTYTFTITGTGVKINQTITGLPVTIAKAYGDAPFNLSATSSSSLAVTYSSSNTNVASITGNTVTIHGAGNTTITASQSGNSTHNAAPDVTGVLTVIKAPLTITADDQTKAAGTANPAFTLSYSGFVNGDNATALGCSAATQTTATLSSATGAYPITVSDCGYTNTNYSYSFVNGSLAVTVGTGIKSIDASNGLAAHPNPTTGELFITAPGNLQLTIYNAQGINVMEQTISEGTNTISLEQLKSGLYILQYTDGSNNRLQYRVIKN